MGKRRTYTDQDFSDAVRLSVSYAEVLRRIGLVPAGGNYALAKHRTIEMGLDVSHLKGQAWSSGKTIGPKKPIEFYLSDNSSSRSHHLKKRLLSEGVMQPVCSSCNMSEWLGGSIPLELDHVDGNTRNNLLSNLRLLCPNCHALTPTYRGRNMKR